MNSCESLCKNGKIFQPTEGDKQQIIETYSKSFDDFRHKFTCIYTEATLYGTTEIEESIKDCFLRWQRLTLKFWKFELMARQRYRGVMRAMHQMGVFDEFQFYK